MEPLFLLVLIIIAFVVLAYVIATGIDNSNTAKLLKNDLEDIKRHLKDISEKL
ncbi:hypothetical protein [Bacillus sp. FJAT-27225]|uniref:hypothetical protein n=1 Tax=Bacillus sp. FJAT-27225 TaxID=1743144 RepID=UPI0015867973|nr:hypothetical protein [Bacillus sp. FJAT-27225]